MAVKHISRFYEQESQRFTPPLQNAKNISQTAKLKANKLRKTKKLMLSFEAEQKFLDRIEDTVKEELRRALFDISAKPTHERANYLLSLVKKADIAAVDYGDSPLSDILLGMAFDIVQNLAEDAEKEFRRVPSSNNYAKWIGERIKCDSLGIDAKSYCPHFSNQGGKPYVVKVKQKDWLSKLAKHYYGKENLWDIIYEQNKMNYHPDRITPGQKLFIP